MKLSVSVLIPVKNEEREIRDCLASVAWSDDVVVVDSGSSDNTTQISAECGARVVQFRYVAGGPKKKNWALENIQFKHPWILILDADERITLELAAEIGSVTASPSPHTGYFINRRFFFLGRWIRHAGYYPSWNMRLFRIASGRYEILQVPETNSGDNEVHEHVILKGSAGHLRAPMDHYAYRSIAQFVEKHNRYSNWESVAGSAAYRELSGGNSAISRGLNRRRLVKSLGRKLPFPHWARFCYHYFLRLGFLDGRAGYILCHLIGEYEFCIWAKTLERTAAGLAPLDVNSNSSLNTSRPENERSLSERV